MRASPTTPARENVVLVGVTRALLAVAVLLAGVWIYARIKSPFPFYGTTYDAKPTAYPLTGTDQDGRPWTLAQTRGKVTLVFFGFTHCPNFCPITLSYLEKARATLSPTERARTQVVFVSVDPERDTPPKLRDYVRFYSPDMTGVNIAPDPLVEAARAYGVAYQKTPLKGGSYSMTHTTATYALDPQGRLRLVYDYTQVPQVDRVAADVRELLKE